MGFVKNYFMEMEEHDEPYDFDSYADFCGSSVVETSIKTFECSIKDRETLFLNHERACNDRTVFPPDMFTPQDIDIELLEMRLNPPRYCPEDEARIIPNWYLGIRDLAWRIFKEEKVQRFVIPSRYFYTSTFVAETLPKLGGVYIVWAGGYDYLTAQKQDLLYIGKAKNFAHRWRNHHQAEAIGAELQELDFYKVYLDCIPISSLAFSSRVSEIILLETLKPRINQRF